MLPENATGRRCLLNPVPIISDRANHKANPIRSPITPGSALHLYRTCAMTTFYTYPELAPSGVDVFFETDQIDLLCFQHINGLEEFPERTPEAVETDYGEGLAA